MSKENLEQFMSKVADSEELQAKIGDVIDTDALIALGAECGCEFTAEQLKELPLRRGNPHHWRKSFVQICNNHRTGMGSVYKRAFRSCLETRNDSTHICHFTCISHVVQFISSASKIVNSQTNEKDRYYARKVPAKPARDRQHELMTDMQPNTYSHCHKS